MQPTRCELNLGEIRHTSTNAFHNVKSSRRDRDAEMERRTIDGLAMKLARFEEDCVYIKYIYIYLKDFRFSLFLSLSLPSLTAG